MKGGDNVILCKKCGSKAKDYTESYFDYWNWFDAAENFYDLHGKICDCCKKEFEDGETVILTDEDNTKL